MKSYHVLFLSLFAILFTSCEAVGGIFKAGVWFGIIGVILVVWLLISLFGKGGKK